MITNTASPLSEWNSLIHRICFVLTWELTGEDRWFIGFLLDLASAECGSQGAGQQVGLCSVSSQATVREDLLQRWRLLGPGWASPPPDWWPVISSSARAKWGCGWSWLLGWDLHLMGHTNTSQGLHGIEIDSRFLLISSGMQNRWTHWLMSLTWFMQQYWMQCCMQHCSTAASACSNDSCHLSW